MPNVTTSIPLKYWNLAQEKHLRWNECLIQGIKALSCRTFIPSSGETIEIESEKSKRIRLQAAMQKTIDDLNKKLEEQELNG